MSRNDESADNKLSIDASRAVAIARKFLEQYHSPVIFKSSYYDNDLWVVAMEVGLLHEYIIIVKIDGKTGKIQGCEHILPS
ncbi:MAG: hypothetical protein KGI25_02220 [Thaumarchaeota archaeon]|nr:hypothetical protein [Nitrososphaerota archaeon]